MSTFSSLSGNIYNGKISKLTGRFNKIDVKDLANGMNDIRRNNEKTIDDEELDR